MRLNHIFYTQINLNFDLKYLKKNIIVNGSGCCKFYINENTFNTINYDQCILYKINLFIIMSYSVIKFIII